MIPAEAARLLATDRCAVALVGTRDERAFDAALTVPVRKLATVTGLNYSNGRHLVLSLYTASPRPMIRIAAAVLLLLLASPAVAQTRLELDATGTAQTTPDQLDATLAARQTGPDPAAVQRRVNDLAAAALHEASTRPAVQQRFLGYDMSQDEKRQWTATSRLSLVSADAPRLLELVGGLQSRGLALESLDWQLSPKLHATEQAEATRTALQALQSRAAQAAEALGLHVDHIVEIHLSQAGQFAPRPFGVMRAMAAPSAPAAPLAVEVTASATVLLRP